MIRLEPDGVVPLVRGTGPTAKRCQVMGHTAMGAIVSVGDRRRVTVVV
jgi:threonine dehydrogenase-like Zn-dependent dehydrogenase